MKKENDNDKIIKIINSKKGFINLSNYCYLNSVIQIIFHIEKFVQYFLIEIKNKNNFKLGAYIDNLLNLIYSNNNSTFENILINYLNSTEESELHNLKKYKNNNEQDSLEFIRDFLIFLHNNFIKKDNNNTTILNNTMKENEFNDYYKNYKHSFISDIFYGISIQTIKCECGYENYIFDRFFDIPIYIDNFKDINKYLDSIYLEKKILLNKYSKCSNCGKILKLIETNKIVKFPYILTLSIQINDEFYLENNKINRIEIPNNLDLNNYKDKDISINNIKELKYELYAVNNYIKKEKDSHYYR